jgi:excisionase family DNA binding protein
MNKPTERYMTTQEMAEWLHLSVNMLTRELRAGTLKGARFGRAGGWRVAESDLRVWIEQHSTEAIRRPLKETQWAQTQLTTTAWRWCRSRRP